MAEAAEHASHCGYDLFSDVAFTCHVNDSLPPNLRSSSKRPFHRKPVDYESERMKFVVPPVPMKCDFCCFYVGAYLPQPGVHETVHKFICELPVNLDKFHLEMTRQEQIACMPYLLFKAPPEPEHVQGPSVNGFTDPIRAPNPNCVCFICQLFSQGEYLFCNAMDTAFMTEDMEKMRNIQDYMTIKSCLRMIYTVSYPEFRKLAQMGTLPTKRKVTKVG